MKNPKRSHLDPNQILVHQYDEDNDAQRVVIVGSDGESIAKSISDALKDIKIEMAPSLPQEDTRQPIIIEKPVIHEVIKEVQVPIIQERIVYVDKPVIVQDVQIIEKPMVIEKVNTVIEYVEKPIIVEREKLIQPTVVYKVLSIIQTIAIVVMALSLFIKRG